MGFGLSFRVNPKLRYCSPLHSPHSFTNSPIWASSSLSLSRRRSPHHGNSTVADDPQASSTLFDIPSRSPAGVRESSFNPTRLCLPSTIYEEGGALQKDFGGVLAFSAPALETLENASLGKETKVNRGKRFLSSVHEMIDNKQIPFGEILAVSTKFHSFSVPHFRLLMENLGVLEETFADSEALRLEKDIILQLEKLGALELFNFCLSKSLGTSLVSDYTDDLTEQVEENKKKCKVDDYKGKVFVQSRKKKENRARKRPFVAPAVSSQSLSLKSNKEDQLRSSPSFIKRTSNIKNRRIMVAKREAELSKGVKVLAELEKIRTAIEEDTKRVASLSSWAEASGVDEKVLQQLLHHGHYCQDELIRSTRSLVLYLAKKYRGMGIALDDLLQAGFVGVVQGAERFDSTRGYKFSTYVQYWIRKSISRMVARYARGIVIPWSLNRAINQIQKAKKSIKNTSTKCPDDYQISNITGLSLDKIRSASNCLRIVASIDQKVGGCSDVEYMELIPDTSIVSPEEAVIKQHMRNDIHDLLKGLDSRERQILTLRFGLHDHQPRSLQDIGRVFNVSKERIRKIEKKALTKLRNEATTAKLNYYLDL